MSTIGERIKAVRKDAGKSMTAFAEDLGISSSGVQCWEYNRNEPSSAMIQLICKKFNVNPLYLSGESDVMHIPPDEDEEIIDRVLDQGDPLMKALLLGIVKKPDGWRLLAESILTAADTLREAGFDLNDKKPGE